MGCINRQVKDLLAIYEHFSVAINMTLIKDNSITTNKQKRGYKPACRLYLYPTRRWVFLVKEFRMTLLNPLICISASRNQLWWVMSFGSTSGKMWHHLYSCFEARKHLSSNTTSRSGWLGQLSVKYVRKYFKMHLATARNFLSSWCFLGNSWTGSKPSRTSSQLQEKD